MANLILASLVIIGTLAFHNNRKFGLSTDATSALQLLVTPMWNESDVNDPSCFLEESHPFEDTLNFHGNINHPCSVSVKAPEDRTAIVALVKTNSDDFIFWAEQLGPHSACSAKYFVVREPQLLCKIVFRHNKMQLNLQGDASITLSTEALESAWIEDCSGYENQYMQNRSAVRNESLTQECLDIMQVQKVLVCNIYSESNFDHVAQSHSLTCKYTLNSTCSSSLTNTSEVKFECLEELINSDTECAIIVYQPNTYALDFKDNKIRGIDQGAFKNLVSLKILDLSNNQLEALQVRTLAGLRKLEMLYLTRNNLRRLDEDVFQDVPNLVLLYIMHNRLEALPTGIFDGLHDLKRLLLAGNRIGFISAELFNDLNKLEILNLYGNNLITLDENVFWGLTNLRALQLEQNQFRNLPLEIFKDLNKMVYLWLKKCNLKNVPNIHHMKSLKLINVDRNLLNDIDRNVFSELPNNSYLVGSHHEICQCYVNSNINCIATGDRSPYLTCDRLLSDRVLVVLMWLIALNALFGNTFVLAFNLKTSSTKSVQDRLLSCLAMSDLLMGIYMIVLASADVYFGDNFPMNAEGWRSGTTCRVIGAISIVSSESSVFFVTLISLDRFVNIQFPYSNRKLSRISVYVVIACTWLFALGLGTIPSVLSGRNFKFYDNSHVCIGLPLALTDLYEARNVLGVVKYVDGILVHRADAETVFLGKIQGMFFSTAVFLGLNGVCYLIIFFCYIGIIRAVNRSSKSIGRTYEFKKQIQMTTKVIAIVATDFCCWFPVIILGTLVQLRIVTLPASVFAWVVTFVLPINSAINPYLYTITSLIGKFRKGEIDSKNNRRVVTNSKPSTISSGV